MLSQNMIQPVNPTHFYLPNFCILKIFLVSPQQQAQMQQRSLKVADNIDQLITSIEKYILSINNLL